VAVDVCSSGELGEIGVLVCAWVAEGGDVFVFTGVAVGLGAFVLTCVLVADGWACSGVGDKVLTAPGVGVKTGVEVGDGCSPSSAGTPLSFKMRRNSLNLSRVFAIGLPLMFWNQ
jgi:hypothetical protein